MGRIVTNEANCMSPNLTAQAGCPGHSTGGVYLVEPGSFHELRKWSWESGKAERLELMAKTRKEIAAQRALEICKGFHWRLS